MGTTAPDQARVVLDIWSTRLTQYASAAGLVVVLYDWLLTIEDEVCPIFWRLGLSQFTFFWQRRLVWPGRPNLPKVLYYINRYLTIPTFLLATYGE